MGSHEIINLGQELLLDDGVANEGEQSAAEVLVRGAVDGGDVAVAEDVEHGLRVARDEPFRFVLQYVSVQLWIHGNYRRTSQYVGFENTPIPVIDDVLLSLFVGVYNLS